MDPYFDQLRRIPLLTADDEVRLAQRIEAGGPDGQQAFDEFVQANLRLVVAVATQYQGRTRLELDELIQEGTLGLIRAVEKFDWRLGYKFSTYATWWIRQAVARGIAHGDRTIRLPVGVHDAVTKVRAATTRLVAELGREPTAEELAAATRMPVAKVHHALDSDHAMSSLDQRLGTDTDAAELVDVLVVTDEETEAVVDELFFADVLAAAERELDARSWFVLRRRFGLDGDEPATLQEIADQLDLSRERVRRIESEALARLRADVAVAA